MSDIGNFVDLYAVLQVQRNCDPKVLEHAYRHLAKAYHPDHPETADLEQFTKVVDAYRVLRDPSTRAQYDKDHQSRFPDEPPTGARASNHLHDPDAASDAEMHEKILSLLYRKRRESAQEAGLGSYHLQLALGCPEDHFDFHIWYLKSKGFIEVTEQGSFAITIDGVDHVMSISRADRAERRLIAQMANGISESF